MCVELLYMLADSPRSDRYGQSAFVPPLSQTTDRRVADRHLYLCLPSSLHADTIPSASTVLPSGLVRFLLCLSPPNWRAGSEAHILSPTLSRAISQGTSGCLPLRHRLRPDSSPMFLFSAHCVQLPSVLTFCIISGLLLLTSKYVSLPICLSRSLSDITLLAPFSSFYLPSPPNPPPPTLSTPSSLHPSAHDENRSGEIAVGPNLLY